MLYEYDLYEFQNYIRQKFRIAPDILHFLVPGIQGYILYISIIPTPLTVPHFFPLRVEFLTLKDAFLSCF